MRVVPCTPIKRKGRRRLRTRGPTIKRDKCYVYFIRAHVGSETLVKIGFTMGDVYQRCKSLGLGSPVELQVIGFFAGMQQDELDLHKEFAAFRRHREWFVLTPELADLIHVRCPDFAGAVYG